MAPLFSLSVVRSNQLLIGPINHALLEGDLAGVDTRAHHATNSQLTHLLAEDTHGLAALDVLIHRLIDGIHDPLDVAGAILEALDDLAALGGIGHTGVLQQLIQEAAHPIRDGILNLRDTVAPQQILLRLEVLVAENGVDQALKIGLGEAGIGVFRQTLDNRVNGLFEILFVRHSCRPPLLGC